MAYREPYRDPAPPFFRTIPSGMRLCWQDKTWSAEVLSSKVDSAVAALRKKKLKPGSKIAVMVENPLDFSRLFLAALRADMIFIPLPTVWKTREIRNTLKLLSPHLIIADEPLLHHFEPETDAVLAMQSLLHGTDMYEGEFATLRKGMENICAILFTSGTSGVPRAVQLTCRNFSASADSWQHLLRFTSRDHYLNCLPLYHIGGISILTRALHYGFAVTFTGHFDAGQVNTLIDEGGITLVSLVPTMLSKLLEERRRAGFPSALRAVILGGGPVPPSLLQRCLTAKVPVICTYGMTETCSGIAGWEPGHAAPLTEKLHLKIGKPFKNVSLKLENGEFVVRGPMVMRGYLDAEISGGVHHSGDFGYADDRGNYYLELRRKDRIITGGENVDPREVENVLGKHPLICDCFVSGRPDEQWGQKVVAYVSGDYLQKQKEHLQKELRQFCKPYLADYKIPREFIILSKIPRNALGKVERWRL